MLKTFFTGKKIEINLSILHFDFFVFLLKVEQTQWLCEQIMVLEYILFLVGLIEFFR